MICNVTFSCWVQPKTRRAVYGTDGGMWRNSDFGSPHAFYSLDSCSSIFSEQEMTKNRSKIEQNAQNRAAARISDESPWVLREKRANVRRKDDVLDFAPFLRLFFCSWSFPARKKSRNTMQHTRTRGTIENHGFSSCQQLYRIPRAEFWAAPSTKT